MKPIPCPFCGHTKPKVEALEDPYPDVGFGFPKHAVVCKCGASGPICGPFLEGKKQAVDKWNTRADKK
jgi:Lar family restriction alleviation protein